MLLLHKRQELHGRQGTAKAITLHQITAAGLKEGALGIGLHPLGHGLQPQGTRQVDNGAHDGGRSTGY